MNYTIDLHELWRWCVSPPQCWGLLVVGYVFCGVFVASMTFRLLGWRLNVSSNSLKAYVGVFIMWPIAVLVWFFTFPFIAIDAMVNIETVHPKKKKDDCAPDEPQNGEEPPDPIVRGSLKFVPNIYYVDEIGNSRYAIGRPSNGQRLGVIHLTFAGKYESNLLNDLIRTRAIHRAFFDLLEMIKCDADPEVSVTALKRFRPVLYTEKGQKLLDSVIEIFKKRTNDGDDDSHKV